MRKNDDTILLSASDLMRFMECRYATALDLRYLNGEDLSPAEDSDEAEILQHYGDAHEDAYFTKLKQSGRSIVEIDRSGHSLEKAAEETVVALKSGHDVVFQGALLQAPWGGWSDFLERVDRPSRLGDFSYEVVDTKLKRRPDRIRDRAAFEAMTLPQLPDDFDAILTKTLEGVAEDAQRQIAEHIAAHDMGEDGETWLSEGVPHIHDESCPFCGQDVKGADLIATYQAYFSDAYNALRDEIAAVAEAVEETFGDAAIAPVERIVEQNSEGATFWKDYCIFDPPQLDEALDVGAALRHLRAAALALLEHKSGAPLEALSHDEAFKKAAQSFETLGTALTAYNAAVEVANAVIAEKKQQTGDADLAAVEAERTGLTAQKTRYEDDPKQACETYQTRQGEKTELEGQKTAIREQLDAHTEQVIEQYGQSINRYLDRINAGFRISTPDHTYRGGTPSSSYQIVINDAEVNLGDAGTPLNQPSFKNTLSSGDRSTLALAFFLAELEQNPDRASKIVVFDDPFTSQDNFRRNHTAFQIKLCGQECAQILLLSHDPNFLKLVWDKLPNGERKTLQLARVGENNTTIAEWDIDKAVQAQYRADITTLHAYYAGGEGGRRNVIQKIRPVLEGYCRNLYPTQFADADMMGVIIGKIRDAGAQHPLFAIIDDLDEINDYCRRYHHAENPNAATEPIDDNELQNYVKRTLGLAGCFY